MLKILESMSEHWRDEFGMGIPDICLAKTNRIKRIKAYEKGVIHCNLLEKGNLNQEKILKELHNELDYLYKIEIKTKEKWEEYNKEFIKNKLGI